MCRGTGTINSPTGLWYGKKRNRQFRRPSVPRPPLSHFLEKLAQNRGSGETRSMREIVTSTCFNLRGVCRNIRTFADDIGKFIILH